MEHVIKVSSTTSLVLNEDGPICNCCGTCHVYLVHRQQGAAHCKIEDTTFCVLSRSHLYTLRAALNKLLGE